MNRPALGAATLACAVLLGACATSSPDVVSGYGAQRLSSVIDATVLSVRPVRIDGSQSGIGAAAGAMVGNVAGSGVGGERDSFVGGILGAVIGGVVGNAFERGSTSQAGVEIVVQTRAGQREAVVQALGSERFAPGDAVMLIDTGGRVTVTKAAVTVMPMAAPPR
ncbi:MAG: hypothetical protein KGL43_09890 [Burkholderiales bacterium]|nr:hypothetical protein [Burkholderiales bacterium]MDE2453894.1 hypothetical protein [Burkholderiales bacterium]